MRLIQSLNRFTMLFSVILLTQSTIANTNDRFGNSKPPQASLAVSFSDEENNAMKHIRSNDVVSPNENWNLSKIKVPESPSPLLFLAGIAILGLMRLRNQTTH